MKIVHLSDLHLAVSKKPNGKMARIDSSLERIFSEKPDAAAITGDFVRYASEENLAFASLFVREIRKRFPTLCVPGNLDYTHYIIYASQEQADEKEKQLMVQEVQLFDKPVFVQKSYSQYIKNLPFYFNVKGKYYELVEDTSAKGIRHAKELARYKSSLGTDEPELNLGDVNLIGFNSNEDTEIKLMGIVRTDNPDRAIYLEEKPDGNISRETLERKLQSQKPGINIAVMHHPLFHIPGANSTYMEFADNEEVAKRFLEKGIQMAIAGHKHIQGFALRKIKISSGEEKDFYVCAAGTLLSRDIKKPTLVTKRDLLILKNKLRKINL